VHFHQVSDNRKAYSDTRVGSRCRAIRLAETIEHVRKEIWIDTHSGIAH
jgi:hypothetical protein